LPLFSADQLRKIATSILQAAGASKEEAEIVGNHMVNSNLYGIDSHGIVRLRLYVRLIRKMAGTDSEVSHMASPGIRPRAEIKVLWETQSAAALDGNWGFGHVTATRAMEMAIAKAKVSGIGITSADNCNHIGRVGEYPEMAAKHNMIGIALTTSGGEPQVAPYGGIDRIFSPNPISIAIPTGRRPILLDASTSMVAGGRISLAKTRNEKIPLGWIVDSEGRPSTDPSAYYGGAVPYTTTSSGSKTRGALLPFGGYKGYGLCLCVEIIGGLLSGAGFSRGGRGNGVVVAAIDVSKFTPIADFKEKTDELIQTVKSSRKSPEIETGEILVPGDKEYMTMEKRLREGIRIEDATWEAIKQTAQELNVNIEAYVNNP